MCKQVILTVLVIACTFGAVAESKVWVILFGSSADSAFVLRDSGARTRAGKLRLKFLLALLLLMRNPVLAEIDKQHQIKKSKYN